jgi:glutathione peroxidase
MHIILEGAPPMSEPVPTSPLDFTLNDIAGKSVSLDQYRGNVVLMVNVASKCGLTPQYASLERLYSELHDRGFEVLGFPANEFGSQEPGSNTDIQEFCSTRYNVTFPMFSKIVVKGEGQHPLYRFLTDKTTDPKFGGEIEWNFAKFLVNRKGEIAGRIPANVDPTTPEVRAQIESLLSE